MPFISLTYVAYIHFRGLCDIRNNGFLNKEQFALAQWLIEEKRMRGKDPPPQLSPDMIPPSLRGADNSIQVTICVLTYHSL